MNNYKENKRHVSLTKDHALLKNVHRILDPMVSHGGIGNNTIQHEVHVVKLYKLEHIHRAIPTVNVVRTF